MTKVRSVCRTRNSPVSEFSHIAKDTKFAIQPWQAHLARIEPILQAYLGSQATSGRLPDLPSVSAYYPVTTHQWPCVPTRHTTGIERPRCVDRLPSHISKMVVSTVCVGGPDWTKSRTEADSRVTPSLGMGMVYVSVASSPVTSLNWPTPWAWAISSPTGASSRYSRHDLPSPAGSARRAERVLRSNALSRCKVPGMRQARR